MLTAVLRKSPDLDEAILYGSRAKGNYRPGSDIDLALKGPALSLTSLNQIANEIDDLLLPFKIDLSIYSQISNASLVEHIDRIGVVFYKRDTASQDCDLIRGGQSKSASRP